MNQMKNNQFIASYSILTAYRMTNKMIWFAVSSESKTVQSFVREDNLKYQLTKLV